MNEWSTSPKWHFFTKKFKMFKDNMKHITCVGAPFCSGRIKVDGRIGYKEASLKVENKE